MKKTIFISIMGILLSLSTFGQFKLTIDGFISEDDKQYFVISVPLKLGRY